MKNLLWRIARVVIASTLVSWAIIWGLSWFFPLGIASYASAFIASLLTSVALHTRVRL
jgi:hypothetical protein